MGQVENWLEENATVQCRYGTKMTRIGCFRYREKNPDACVGCPEIGGARPDKKARKSNWSTTFRQTVFREAVMSIDVLFEKKESIDVEMVRPKIPVIILDRIAKIQEKTNRDRDEIIAILLEAGLKAYDEASAAKKG